VTIAAMQSEDIPAVLALERNTLSAWSQGHLEEELQQPAGIQLVARTGANQRITAVLCGRIMGNEAEILKLSVAPDARRQGIGSKLLDAFLNYCGEKGVKNCFLELRASNTPARNLYEKGGFLPVGSRKNYYDAPRENALLMQLTLQGQAKTSLTEADQ